MSRHLGLAMLFLDAPAALAARMKRRSAGAKRQSRSYSWRPAARPRPSPPCCSARTAKRCTPPGSTRWCASGNREDDKKPGWTLKRSFRVPIGPGVSGAINALALSPDGRWLAVGGRSVMRGEADFQPAGRGRADRSAVGDDVARRRHDSTSSTCAIRRAARCCAAIRVRCGRWRSRRSGPASRRCLVSAAYEFAGGKPVGGSVRLWDVEKGGEALAVLAEKLPALQENPGLGRVAHRRRQQGRARGGRVAGNRPDQWQWAVAFVGRRRQERLQSWECGRATARRRFSASRATNRAW